MVNSGFNKMGNYYSTQGQVDLEPPPRRNQQLKTAFYVIRL